MKKDTEVRIVKLNAVENPVSPTPDMKDYIPGQDNGPVSIPVAYEITGTLNDDIEVGKGISALRTTRNGVRALGLFTTSPVTKIEGDLVSTNNSVYRVTTLG